MGYTVSEWSKLTSHSASWSSVSHKNFQSFDVLFHYSVSVSFSTCPLFFEMTAELAYPVNEGAVGGFLTAIYNFVGIVFLFLFFIPSLTRGKDIWISYTLVGSTIAAIPATALVTENYNRSNADKELEYWMCPTYIFIKMAIICCVFVWILKAVYYSTIIWQSNWLFGRFIFYLKHVPYHNIAEAG